VIFLVASIAIYIPVILIANQLYAEELERHYITLQSQSGGALDVPTGAEQQVFTYKMIRDSAGLSMLLAVGCAVYAGIKLLSRSESDAIP
jgi:hypothetical protein